MDFEETPNLTYFFLASPNLEDEIHFKGGRFVTSQNSKFWNVILNKLLWFVVWLIDWKWVKFETFEVGWEGTKWLSQTFILAFYLNEFKFISTQNPRLKLTWLLPFEFQRVFEKIWIPFGNISNSETLSNLMICMREDKMTSPNIWNMSWKFKIIKFKDLLEIIFNLELFGFYSNYFSPKIKYMDIRVKWFPTLENWREINLNLFWYF